MAGLTICDELRDPDCEAGELRCVMIDSWGPGADLFLQRRDMEPNLLLRRWVLGGAAAGAEVGCSIDRRRLYSGGAAEEVEDQSSASLKVHSGCTGELDGEGSPPK